MKALSIAFVVAAAVTVIGASSSYAQGYSLTWYTIAGGGASTGGVYSAKATVGQHDAGGPLTGTNYSISGGFWTVNLVQTVTAPLMTIKSTGTNTVIITWPAPANGFVLQQNLNLTTANWINATDTVSTVNGTNQVTIHPIGNRYYRLQHP